MLTPGETTWGPMMRVSGPPIYSEMDLLVMATNKRVANATVESLIQAAEFIEKHYRIPTLVLLSEEP